MRGYNMLVAVLAAVSVTVAMRTVGLLLVSALMVVPVATSQQTHPLLPDHHRRRYGAGRARLGRRPGGGHLRVVPGDGGTGADHRAARPRVLRRGLATRHLDPPPGPPARALRHRRAGRAPGLLRASARPRAGLRAPRRAARRPCGLRPRRPPPRRPRRPLRRALSLDGASAPGRVA
ncbi:metal ABC transporter permease [Nocardioides convexus]|uniref:metal ABC transporter permease n=1 Tax=Nocardioides convexus TaxID=2712224 RepID=UPI003100AFE1